ncbi:MAG TPA: response regulator transcription factor [Chloroflexia bacterium]|nr:response regulator transcription factor [Chloroflexia bacterium]
MTENNKQWQGTAAVKPDQPIKIVLADDHTIVRDGVAHLLNAEPDFQVVGSAGDGQEAIEMVCHLKPDVVLMDLQMPNLDGVTAIKRIRAEDEQIKIIILTTYDTDEYILEGIRAGAKGYLLKDVPKEELFRSIRLVNRGQSLMQPSLTARVFNLLAQRESKESDASLTERELEVIRLIAQGDRNKEIAQKMAVSEGTVKSYVASILQKFGVSDRTQAAMYAVQKGLIQL